MIDLHNHLLPGLDDGAQGWEDTLHLAKAAVEEGIRIVVATPHHANGTYWNEASVVQKAVDATNAFLQRHQVPLTVAPGQEIRVYDQLLDDLDAGKLLTLHASSYLLLEFPSSHVPRRCDELIYEMRRMGITPILAHPERNRELANRPDRLAQLIEAGALSQITSHSLNGTFGKKLQKLSLAWCRKNLVHVVASDAHHVQRRGYGMERAFRLISRELGVQAAEKLRHNASCIVANERIEFENSKVRTKKLFPFRKL